MQLLVMNEVIPLVQGLLNLAANMYTAAKTYPGAYSQKIRANVCNSQFGHGQISPTGAIIASAGGCKGPYDAYNGSALAWCAPARAFLVCPMTQLILTPTLPHPLCTMCAVLSTTLVARDSVDSL